MRTPRKRFTSPFLWLATALATAGPAMGLVSRAAVAAERPDEKPADVVRPSLPLDRMVGRRASNFTLKDVRTGGSVSLYQFRGKRAVVLAFLGTDCPVANLYAPRLNEIAREFESKGVVVLGINSNAHDTVERIAAHAKEYGLGFPVLKDERNVVSDSLLVERTAEVLVLDGLATIRYRGAIDDQYAVGARKDAPDHTYLKDAITEVVTSGRVEVKGTPVAGCVLARVEPTSGDPSTLGNGPRIRPAAPEIVEALRDLEPAEVKVGPVTYASDVATIVQNKCQSCHRPGEVGPFSLLTYDDARKHAGMIREVVDDRRMPPWHADPRHGTFQNDRSLSATERATLLAWVDQGTPLGDASQLPPPRSFPEGWSIGTPDAVFEIPEPNVIPAQGTVEYVRIRVPSGFKEDVWVQAAEARPEDRSIVHHIIVYVLPRGLMGGGRGNFRADAHLCGYAPGDMPSVYPEGSAKKIPAGSDLLFEIHYTPTGTLKTDRSKVGLIFAKAPVKHQAHTLGIAQERFEIPPGADNHEVRSSFVFRNDAHLLSFMPHMHLRGKSFEYRVTFPDGEKRTLLSVPAYDFGWQSYYTLAEPLAMPKGTRIDCTAHFDNSEANPYNPDPSKRVRWGDQTTEEMMIGYIDYIDDDPPGSVEVAEPAPNVGALFRALRPRNDRPKDRN
ncbi:MAG: redoxin domain-containing protein [Isosphaeraceae bacterium]